MLMLPRGGTKIPLVPVSARMTWMLADVDLFCTITITRLSGVGATTRAVEADVPTVTSVWVKPRISGEENEKLAIGVY